MSGSAVWRKDCARDGAGEKGKGGEEKEKNDLKIGRLTLGYECVRSRLMCDRSHSCKIVNVCGAVLVR